MFLLLKGHMESKLKVRSMKLLTVEPNTKLTVYDKIPNRSLYGVQGLLYAHLWLDQSISYLQIKPSLLLHKAWKCLYLKVRCCLILLYKIPHMTFWNFLCVILFKMLVTVRQIFENLMFWCFLCILFSGTYVHVLTSKQIGSLEKCLYAHQNVFLTKENPQLGFTNLVQHEIHLKPNLFWS